MCVPWTLYWYIGRELLRLFLLTLVVLVWVMAFGIAVKPLSEGQLSVVDALVYISMGVVWMLQFATPFAAGFAGTLAYHRIAADNELIACTASGIGHRTILTPALFGGVVLTVVSLVIAHQAAPGIIRNMERMLRADIANAVVASIERGDTVQFDDVSIYADSAKHLPIDDAADPRPTARIGLFGMAATVSKSRHQPPDLLTARQAEIVFYQDGDDLVVSMGLIDAALRHEGNLTRIERWSPKDPMRLVSPVRDDPKFETWAGLRRVAADPDAYPVIRGIALELAEALGRWQISRQVHQRLQRFGMVSLVSPPSGDRPREEWTITAGGLEWVPPYPRILPAPGSDTVALRRHSADGHVQEYVGADISIEPKHIGQANERGAYFDVHMRGEISVTDTKTGVQTQRSDLDVTNLYLMDDPSRPFFQLTADELIEEARKEQYKGDQFIEPQRDALVDRIAFLRREVLSKHHERAAISISCLVMVSAGAVMAIRLRHGLPLVVHLWSFLPALGTVILISSGQQVMVARDVSAGIVVMWSGVTLLALLTLAVFSKIRRH
jgi:lipopolysaccharide export system permease protein